MLVSGRVISLSRLRTISTELFTVEFRVDYLKAPHTYSDLYGQYNLLYAQRWGKAAKWKVLTPKSYPN